MSLFFHLSSVTVSVGYFWISLHIELYTVWFCLVCITNVPVIELDVYSILVISVDEVYPFCVLPDILLVYPCC